MSNLDTKQTSNEQTNNALANSSESQTNQTNHAMITKEIATIAYLATDVDSYNELALYCAKEGLEATLLPDDLAINIVPTGDDIPEVTKFIDANHLQFSDIRDLGVVSPDNVAELKREIESLKEELATLQKKYAEEVSDANNYRRWWQESVDINRKAKEQLNAIQVLMSNINLEG